MTRASAEMGLSRIRLLVGKKLTKSMIFSRFERMIGHVEIESFQPPFGGSSEEYWTMRERAIQQYCVSDEG